MTCALLIIDLQRALCEGQWAMHDVDAVLARVDALAERARVAGAPVVCIQHQADDSPMAQGSAGYGVTLVADAHTTLGNGVLSAEQIIAHVNATVSNWDSYGPAAAASPAAQVRF